MADLRLGNGVVLTLDGDERDGSVYLPIVHTGSFEPHVLATLPSLLRSDSWVVDAGANIGVVSLACARSTPGCRVVAFEASPATAAYLRANVAANAPGAVTVVEAALAAAPGTVHLRTDETFQGGAHVTVDPERGDVAVPAVTLDGWMAEHPVGRIDLVKLDVEGAELDVLAGATETFARHRPQLLVEVNALALRRVGRSAEELWGELRRMYRHRYLIEESGRLHTLHGWGHLERRLRHRGAVDLLCTTRRRAGVSPWHGRRNAVGTLWRAWTARGRTPEVLLSARYDLIPAVDSADVTPGGVVRVPVRIVNRTGQHLTSEWPRCAVNLSYHLEADGTTIHRDGTRAPIPACRPNASVEVELELRAPREPGTYVARLSLVQEAYAWGLELGGPRDATVTLHVC